MIHASKKTRAINSFEFVVIPSPRDIFLKYGERFGKGECTCSAGEIGDPVMVGSSSTIDQMINAQRLAQAYENKA